MTLDINTGEVISLDEAIRFTHSFQEQNPLQLKSFSVGEEKIKVILQQVNCVGVRIYNEYDIDKGQANLVLVGVNKDGEEVR